jgi:amino acid adenylation domain-containing protein
LADGHIEFLGRIDFQVKIRGFRIELGEIEYRLIKHDEIKEAVVLNAVRGDEDTGDKYLCAYIVSDREMEISGLNEYLSKYLPAYMIPSYIMQIEKIPLTGNGKVDRKALPVPELKASGAYAAPGNEIEEKLVDIWAEVLGIDKEIIGIHDNFFEKGGHSLKATIMAAVIDKTFGVKVPLGEIFKGPTIHEIMEFLCLAQREDKGKRRGTGTVIDAVEQKEYYPLSSAQKRMYFLQQMDLESTAYNMPLVFPPGKEIDKDRLESALKKLVARHESLRTSFIRVKDEPVQVVHDHVEFEIEFFDLAANNAKEREEENIIGNFVQPFDLSQAPLVRSGLIRLPDDNHTWMVDIHHIVSDGTSHSILMEDFFALYNGYMLEPLRIHYKDFSGWQNHLFESGRIKVQEEYWFELFSDVGGLPRVNMPVDHERPRVFTFAGDVHEFRLDREETEKFKALASGNNGTLYMNILAALNALFYKYTGQTDIIIGSGIAGRPHADLQRIIGMFINTLAMRNYPNGEKTYESLLRQVIANSVRAFENQDVQFEELVDKLEVERDPSRNPLFDISLVVQNFMRGDFREGHLEGDNQLENKTTKFDMTFFAVERAGDVYIGIEYYTGIFKRETVERLGSHFKNVVNAVIKEPSIKLKDMDIISAVEKQRLVYAFNDTVEAYPGYKTVHELFAEQVEKTPENSSLVYENEILTYNELNREADRLARYLYYKKNAGQEDRMGILISHPLYLAIAVIGVLKAGGVYVPIDPILPRDRKKYMIKDAGIGIVISEKKYSSEVERLQWECGGFHSYLCMDTPGVDWEDAVERNEHIVMNEEMWNHVGRTSTDEISGGGWISSYTGEPMSRAEICEYGENILKKLGPLLDKNMRVLEIGCASGISMYGIAPQVGFYYGTDLAEVIIEKNKQRVEEEGLPNIKLACTAAHEIDKLGEENFDLIIMNSVIQCFYGYSYLRTVIKKAVDLLGEKGRLFIGDIMDLEKKGELVREMEVFKRTHAYRGNNYKTKTDFTSELFVSREFWQDAAAELAGVESIEFSDKIYTIENELTKFRYDVLITINKNKRESTGREREKRKYRDDRSALCAFVTEALHLKVPSGSMAYIIYTSGTTGEPKGVEVEHRGVVNTLFYRKREYEMAPGFVSLQLFFYGFDGFVTSFFTPLISGAKVVLLKKEEMGDIEKIREAVVKEGVTHFISVPPLYSAVVEFFTRQDFSTIKAVTLAGDKVSSNILARTGVKSDTVEIVNEYGVTESSVMSTIYRHQEQDRVIKIGRPIGNTCLYILDGGQRLQPIGVSGELCISGEGLARGYLNNPELTNEKFLRGGGSFFKKSPPGRRRQKIYKTGDSARWLADGNIEFSGRMDQQVKLRGFRIEPAEIESRLLKHEFIRETVVTAGEENGETYLCAYIVPVDESVNMESVRAGLAGFLPDYMIPGYFVQVEKIPLTSSGKVDRKKLPGPQIRTGETYTAPGNEIETKLADIWSEVLGLGGHKPIGIDDNFFELGGHSLKATILTAKIHKEFDVKVPLAEIFTRRTIRELGRYIEGAAAERYTSIENAEEKEYYVLSSAQKRLYILQQFDPGSTAYNIPAVIPIPGEVDIEQLQKTFTRLISRHESLRTSFHMVGDEPVQIVHEDVESGIEYSLAGEAAGGSGKSRSSFVRPFDLSAAPLLRVGLIKEEEQKTVLLVDMHHIITDGTSHNILEKEFMTLYWRPDTELGALRLRYKDFARWQNCEDQLEAIKRQESYWLEVFFGDLPVLNLPIDYPRPLMQGFEGSTVNFVLSDAETRTLKDMAGETGATLYMSILCVFTVLLAKLSSQEDMAVGTPIAARRHADLEPVIGMFVNTLAMRNEPAPGKKFNEFLSEVKNRALKAFENQEYQFEDLVEKVSVQRDTGRNPVFDVMFNLLNQADYTGHVPQMDGPHNYEHRESTSKFDLNLTAVDLGQRLLFSIEYSTRLFKPGTIERIIGYFKQVLFLLSLPADRSLLLREIEIITGEEKQEILKIANGVEEIIDDTGQTILRLFEKKAEETPDGTAAVCVRHAITYRELNDQSNRLAYLLRQKGVGPGAIVGIKVERSLELIVGIIGILKAGGGYLPIDPDYPRERIDFMLADSNARVLLSEVSELSKVSEGTEAVITHPTHLCYLIYTSGSTGRPKGVMMEHRNLVNLIKYQYKYTNIDFTRVLQFASIGFDVSFQEIFSTLIAGGTLFLTDKKTRGDVLRLFKVIEENRIKTLFLPASYLKFVFSEESYTGLLPGCVDHIVAAGEQLVVTEESRNYLCLNRVYLHNHYGPSETHVVTTLTPGPGEEIPGLPSIGRPVMNTGIYILDAGYHLQPVNVPGELYIGGRQVCRGYLNNPELTNEKFLRGGPGGAVFSKSAPPGRRRQKIYKTGDLGRWLPDKNIEFLGRIDQQVKIRGFRVEPGEIESLLMKYPDVKEAVVSVREDGSNDRYLCAYIVGAVEVSVLRKYLSQMLPDYMVPSYFVPMESIPLTANKKVDRKQLPQPGITAGEAYAAPGNEIEKKLVRIWAEVLGSGEDGHIGIDDNFFESGGHSLKATILAAKIHKNLDVNVPLAEVFKSPTIRGLSRFIQKAQKTGYEIIEPIEKKEYYPLSSAQKRMYFLQQLDVKSTGYNVPMILPLGKDIEIDEFGSRIKELIARHESLRTSFVMVHDQPVQRIHNQVEFEIEFFDLAAKNAKKREEEEKIIHRFIRVFDLSQAPLIRVGIFKFPGGYYLLIVDMHHIITDGISREVLKEDFINLTRGEPPDPLRVRYRDFSQWQNHLIESGRIKAQEDYWLELYADAGEIPRLELPTDDKRPEFFTFSGAHYGFMLDKEDAAAFKVVGSRHGATLYMNMLTALNTLFYKYTGQTDIIMGTGIAGRRYVDLQRIIGMFVNTLAMRNYPGGEKTYESFLEDVIATSVRAFENQDVQFEELVDKLELERDTSRNPLFDISMVVQDFKPAVTGEEGNLSPGEHNQINETAKFDMTFFIMEYDEGVYIDIEYYTGIFKEETIRRLALHLKNIVKTVASTPSVMLKDIDILSAAERRQVLDEFNDTGRRYPNDKTIHELFVEQAERSCDGTAVVCMRRAVTYRELDKKSNQAAHLLRKKGVRPDTVVGIMVEPSIEMVVGILGILKAGGAYLPIAPSYPQERIDYMLTDSSAKVLLSEVSGLSKEPTHLTHLTHPTHLCYVIYTSGTTGMPKGVAVEHRCAVNTLTCRKEEYAMRPQDVSLQLFSYSFDGFVTSFFTPLLSGVRSVLMENGGIKDIAAIKDVIIKEGVTHFISVPALYRAIMENLSPGEACGLKVITLAGDRVMPDILELTKQKNSNLEIAHEYGVTEAAVMSTLYRHQGEHDTITIGAPIWNTRVYIVNQDLGLQPVGAAGELFIGGDGLARGYLNNPELTAEKFIPVFYRSYRSYRSYRYYKTGDLARWLPDGNIEFSGRIDQQVKIRGFRIELAEIEYRLMRHAKIKEAVVEDRQDVDGGDRYLCAYIVLIDEVGAAELKGYLSAGLPDYMIPTYFVPIERIPLTFHGKVDRKKLPGPGIGAGVKYTPPGNDVEKKLAAIWSEVIDVPQPIGIDDNFFELGGHSLKAAILTAKIHEKFGVNVPLAELFKRQTIRMLAEFLLELAAEDKKQPAVDDHLVLLRKGAEEADNMFFIHAGSGDVEVYVEFCNHLHPGFNYWGIRIVAGRLENLSPQHWSIEALAQEYVQTIKNVQPHGPYRLVGWSIGGTIAFEMVRQLEQMGEQVGFFAMIDTSAPNITLAKTAKRSTLEMVDHFEEDEMDVAMIKSKIPRPIREAMPDMDRLGGGEIIYYRNVIRSLDYARNVYLPDGKISTAVHFFGAGYRGGIGKDKYSMVKQWKEYITGQFNYYEVDGDHYSLFKKPHVVVFAEMFDKETGE